MAYDLVGSSGHGKYVAGASKYLNEVKEARRVMNRVAEILRLSGGKVDVFHDDTSKTVNTNLSTIVKHHNKKTRKLDISVHFNASRVTSQPMGTEVYYFKSQYRSLAGKLSKEIANAGGFKDRGPKMNQKLYFLRNTTKPALLLEICFVDSSKDAELYNKNFEKICQGIAKVLASHLDIKVSKPSTGTSKPSRPSSEEKIRYHVKSGTYNTKVEANMAAKKVTDLKIASVVELKKEGTKYYFQTGWYTTKASATNALEKMKDNKILWVGEVITVKM